MSRLQRQLALKNLHIEAIKEALQLSGLTLDLSLSLLNDDNSEFHKILEVVKSSKNKNIQEGYQRFLGKNYQYLTENGVPTQNFLEKRLKEATERAKFACFLQKSEKNMLGYAKSSLAYYMTPYGLEDVDTNRTITKLMQAQKLMSEGKLIGCLSLLEGLGGMARGELEGVIESLKVRVDLEEMTNLLAMQFKTNILNI